MSPSTGPRRIAGRVGPRGPSFVQAGGVRNTRRDPEGMGRRWVLAGGGLRIRDRKRLKKRRRRETVSEVRRRKRTVVWPRRNDDPGGPN